MDRVIDMVIGMMWWCEICLQIFLIRFSFQRVFSFFLFLLLFFLRYTCLVGFKIRTRLSISSLVRWQKLRYRNTNFIAKKGVYLCFISFRELWMLWNYDRKSGENGIKIEYRSGPIWKSGFCSLASFRWRE